MAKMFYTLEEAAQTLSVSEDQIKQMAESGQLQQFRDRDKLMFKREQVDGLLSMQQTMKTDRMSETDDEITIADDAKARTSETDTIDLVSGGGGEVSKKDKKSATATGISVFDADEVQAADPMAQTQVTSSFVTDDDELSLDSIGSGSGLLDLTRESDDTSLGAVELLEDIVPGGEASDSKFGDASSLGSVPGSSTGIFEGETSETPSGLAELESGASMSGGFEAAYMVEESDPVGDGFGGGMMMGVFAVLVVLAIVLIPALNGQIVELTKMMTDGNTGEKAQTMLMWCGGLFLVCVVLGVIGLFIGKSRAKG